MKRFLALLLAIAASWPVQAEPLKIRIQYATLGQFVPLIPSSRPSSLESSNSSSQRRE